MADLKMNQFADGQLSATMMLVGYDPAANTAGERKFVGTNLVSFLTGALPFASNSNPTINGNVSAGNFIVGNNSAASAGAFGFINANGPAIQTWGTSTVNPGALTFLTAGAERARFSNAGNLLINSVSDDGVNKLQVNGLAKATSYTSTGLDSGGANFRLQNSRDAFLRNDGSSFYILGSNSTGQSATFNSFRPFAFNLQSGAVTLDATGAGVSTGGSLNTQTLFATGVNSTGPVIGGGNRSALIAASGGTGQTSIFLQRSGTTDQNIWELLQSAQGVFQIRTVNDAYSAATAALSVSRAASGVGLANLTLMPQQGNVLVGPTTDDGGNILQVAGNVRANNYVIADQSAGASGLVGIASGANGPNIGFFGASTTGAGTMTFATAGVTRMTINSGGLVTIGTAVPAAGPGTLTLGNSMIMYSQGQDTVASISTAARADGLSIEAFNGPNTVKKNIALAPFGGRVLMGTGVADDGTNTLQVQGSARFGDNISISKAGATFIANDTTSVNSAAFLMSRNSKPTWAWNADFTSNDQLTLLSYDESGNPAHNVMVAKRSTSAIQIPTRLSVGTFADDGTNPLQVVGNASIQGSIVMPSPNTGINIGSSSVAGQSSINFSTGALGSGSAFDGRIVALGGTTGQTQTADMIYIGGTHQFRIGVGGNGLTINGANRVLVGAATDDGSSQLQVQGNLRVSGVINAGTINATTLNVANLSVPSTVTVTGAAQVGTKMTNTAANATWETFVDTDANYKIATVGSGGTPGTASITVQPSGNAVFNGLIQMSGGGQFLSNGDVFMQFRNQKLSDVLNLKANAGQQATYQAGFQSEFGFIGTNGAQVNVVDLPNPWVLNGLRQAGGSSILAIWLRGIVLQAN
ncbi:MAG: hypothetical protein V4807_12290 [Burkholderia gladioli]|uniref:beta strand repeat-containing protein n=1 Tax=Burkholderia gladioli TaxID=28095 RepID=UPI00285D0113|nr:hypothetical protein [Burkholderia gladioli]MDR8091083.1 hypothetical protein [Burkholderia gladioli]